jgi:hypothetical protein
VRRIAKTPTRERPFKIKWLNKVKGELQEPSLLTDNNRCPLTSTDILPNPDPDIDDSVNTPIINDTEVIVGDDFSFERIWDMYDKKVGKVATLQEK